MALFNLINPGYQFLSLTLDKNVIFCKYYFSAKRGWIDTLWSINAALSLALLSRGGGCGAVQMLCTFATVSDRRGSSEVPPVCTQQVEGRLQRALPEVQLVCVCSQDCSV